MHIEELLRLVQVPARYAGGEINCSRKDITPETLTFALCYPDLYELGMSSLGVRILYGLLNEMEGVACERVFAPAPDMEALLKERGIPLFTLESKRPVREFDLLGFSVSSELNYTNVLNLLSLSGIPVFARDRTGGDPLVIIGGNSAFNPAPLVPFADVFVVGEAEDVMGELVERMRPLKTGSREEKLRQCADIEGVFVPVFPRPTVSKRFVKDLNASFFPVKWMVPLTEIVHDRISLEIMRGCKQGCKFCGAGRCWRPVRARSKEAILDLAEQTYANSGYEEISLLSFSSGDHPDIAAVVETLVGRFADRKVSVSFPSLRIDTFSFDLANKIRTIRKTGLTFAPESSERLRQAVGKDIRDSELLDLAAKAKSAGWRQIKLYFMLGLPGETAADVDEIVRLIWELSRILNISVSFTTFVPKPHTPLECSRFTSREEIIAGQRSVRERLDKNRHVKISFQPYDMSMAEAFLGRGDENLARVIHRAWEIGAKMENWSEHFNPALWLRAFENTGISMDAYLSELTSPSLPWSFIRM